MTRKPESNMRVGGIMGVLVCVCVAGAGAGAVRGGENGPSRMIREEVTVSASLADVWHAWTTAEGMATFFAPQANIELRMGGAYEPFIKPDAPEGSRGCEGCKVLAFVPLEMLSFEWNAPPSVPGLRDKQIRSYVVLRFAPVGENEVRVSLAHLGFGEGPDWEKCYEYFSAAWPKVLASLKEAGPKFAAQFKIVKHIAQLRYESVVDAPVAKVWELFTTKEGIESWMVPMARVDFRAGGTLRTNYSANAGDDHPGWITHHLLTVEPGRMYASRVSAPPNAPVAKVLENTWGVVMFHPAGEGRTRISMHSCDWGVGPDWDAAEKFFAEGNNWTIEQLRKRLLAGSKPSE